MRPFETIILAAYAIAVVYGIQKYSTIDLSNSAEIVAPIVMFSIALGYMPITKARNWHPSEMRLYQRRFLPTAIVAILPFTFLGFIDLGSYETDFMQKESWAFVLCSYFSAQFGILLALGERSSLYEPGKTPVRVAKHRALLQHENQS